MQGLATVAAALVGAAVGAAIAVTLLAKPAPACDTDLLRAEVSSMRTELVALRAKLAEAPAPPKPDRVSIRITADPPGAEVVDDTGRVLGRTPLQITVPASSTPRTFKLRLPGYTELAVELVPDRDLEYTATLAKRAPGGKPNPYRARPDDDLMKNPFDSARP